MCSATLISTARAADKDTFGIVTEALSEPSDDRRASSNAISMTDCSIDRPSNDRSLRQNHRDTQDPDKQRRQTSGRSPLVPAPDARAVHEQDASPLGAAPTGEQQGPHAAVKDVRQRGPVLNLTKSKAGAVSRARTLPATKARKRFRPKVAHHNSVSPAQEEYFASAVRKMSRFAETRALATSITKCGTTRTADGRTIRTIKCGHPICPRCRRAQIQRRIEAANRTFDHPRFRTLWWVTVLNAVLPGSPMDLGVRDPFEPEKPLVAPPASSIRDWIGPALARAKTDLDKCLASLAPASLAADGSFEFDVFPVTGAGAQKNRFLQSLKAAQPQAFVPPAKDLFLLHVHMMVSASRSGAPVGRDEIAAALRTRFLHPHQVEVRPLDARKLRHTNIKNLASYALKTKTDFRAERVRDLALILKALGWRALAFRRCWTRTRARTRHRQ